MGIVGLAIPFIFYIVIVFEMPNSLQENIKNMILKFHIETLTCKKDTNLFSIINN